MTAGQVPFPECWAGGSRQARGRERRGGGHGRQVCIFFFFSQRRIRFGPHSSPHSQGVLDSQLLSRPAWQLSPPSAVCCGLFDLIGWTVVLLERKGRVFLGLCKLSACRCLAMTPTLGSAAMSRDVSHPHQQQQGLGPGETFSSHVPALHPGLAIFQVHLLWGGPLQPSWQPPAL